MIHTNEQKEGYLGCCAVQSDGGRLQHSTSTWLRLCILFRTTRFYRKILMVFFWGGGTYAYSEGEQYYYVLYTKGLRVLAGLNWHRKDPVAAFSKHNNEHPCSINMIIPWPLKRLSGSHNRLCAVELIRGDIQCYRLRVLKHDSEATIGTVTYKVYSPLSLCIQTEQQRLLKLRWMPLTQLTTVKSVSWQQWWWAGRCCITLFAKMLIQSWQAGG
jgi:hypothetical protein